MIPFTHFTFYGGPHCGEEVEWDDDCISVSNDVYARPHGDDGTILYYVPHWLVKHTPDRASIAAEFRYTKAWIMHVYGLIQGGMDQREAIRSQPIMICRKRFSMHQALLRVGVDSCPTSF